MPEKPTTNNDASDDAAAPAAESFDDFYAANQPRYLRRLSRRLSKDEAKDVMQDVFIKVWIAQRAKTVRNYAAVAERAIKNAIVDRWRKQHTRQTHESQFALEQELLQAAPSGVESAALQAERLRLLLELRIERPDAYHAYVLRRHSGLEISEIADVMGIGRNKVSKLVQIALIKLHSAGMGGDTL